MSVAIIGNGEINRLEQPKRFTTIIAADGGFDACQALNITPTHTIGDGDSISNPPVHFSASSDQTTTDLMKALAVAKQVAPGEPIELFGVISSDRIDHTQAAYWALQYEPNIYCLHTDNQTVYYLKPGVTHTLPNNLAFSAVPTTAAAIIELNNCEWSGRFTLNGTYSGINNAAKHDATLTVVSGCIFLTLWN